MASPEQRDSSAASSVQAANARASTSDLVALVRSPDKATDLGVAVREADYDRPETLDRAPRRREKR